MAKTIKKPLSVDRRSLLKATGVGVLAVAGSGLLSRTAQATPETAAKKLSELTGGAAVKQGKVNVKLPEIAENGRTVPMTVSVDSPMSSGNYVKTIHVVAEGNPNPDVVSFNLSPGTGKAEVATRIRLGKTQNVVARAVMSDGSVYEGKRQVKVTIGGCGG
ncbi:MAG: thiosulfate oxidation carrier protein SoxY [Rhodospirillales bacterium]|nr:thiosulfate oxidation carrier protein SoxY [Rhodospirillales bacterium]